VSAARLSHLVLLLALAPAWAREAEPLSPRNANYDIDVALDVETRTLEGRAVVEWRNIQSVSTDELWLHLYWNAWRTNRSTWMLENRIARRAGRRRSGGRDWPDKDDWSWIEIDSLRLLTGEAGDGPELERRFVSPDDANPDDRTVMVVTLPQQVGPGESVRVSVSWRARIPRTFARTGYRGDFYFFGQWFPKLGVFEPDGWNCHQFHAATEFYSDYGVYDVRMTVPGDYVVGATGREIERTDHADGTATHRYVQEDVHDFAWTASPHYRVLQDRFAVEDLPPVELRLLIQPEHVGQAERHFAAARVALEWFGRWFGPYPYAQLTLVDPAYDSGAGGMEYPTLASGGTRRFAPSGVHSPESVIVHEVGHQFWYGVVGNNEFEHAWLDEGLTVYAGTRALATAYGDRMLARRYLRRFVPLRFPEIRESGWTRRLNRYRASGGADAPSEPSYTHYPSTAGAVNYAKTALWLATLERHLGWDVLRRILATFFERYRFSHPTPEDFFAVADEVAGQDLSWFFDQVHRDSVHFDYQISRARSSPVRPSGWGDRGADGLPVRLGGGRTADDDVGDSDEQESDSEGEQLYRTEVVVRRNGAGRFPVDVLLVFDDGHEVREHWDGLARWKMFVVERPSELDYAEVDPDRVLLLDTYPSNNSLMRRQEASLPATKWGSKWMIWFQDRLSSMAFFM
jgi:hypothetical protein